MNLNAAASEISVEKYSGSLQQRESLAESAEPLLGWATDTQADTVLMSGASEKQREVNFLQEEGFEPVGEAVFLHRKIE